MCQALQEFVGRAVLVDLTRDRRVSYLFLAIALSVSLGTAQFVMPVKQVLFYDLVGPEKDPLAKSLTIVILLPLLFMYSLLVSLLPGPATLVFVISAVYALIYLGVSLAMMVADEHPAPWIAWLLYYATETKGVIIMPMMWSVIAEISTPALAAKAYPFIFAMIQIGGVLGSLVAIKVRSFGGPVYLLLLQAVLFLVVALFNWLALQVLSKASWNEIKANEISTNRVADVTTVGKTLEDPDPLIEKQLDNVDIDNMNKADSVQKEKRDKAVSVQKGIGTQTNGSYKSAVHQAMKVFWDGSEGLWLLISRPYAFMIFWVSYANLVPRTVLDYESSVLIVAGFATSNERVDFWGKLNLIQNIGTTLLSLFGTRSIVESLGVGNSLLALPVVSLCCVLALCLHFGLWTSVCSVVVSSVIAYGLNSPCKEMLFVQTSKEIKYKAKSWSEMYGNNFMKLLGSQINMWINQQSDKCSPNCFHKGATALIVILWTFVWIRVVLKVKTDYKKLQSTEGVVE